MRFIEFEQKHQQHQDSTTLAQIEEDPTKTSVRDHVPKMIADLPRHGALYIETAQN
ncbi:hypothetical protein [Burkholderia ubonensis]|uniref:hypothetical protein n=1 Tax=Burkholderia ubonensis TaxID=101571 RepID=UPI000A460694|nr:hypothetical protein [Burkholderia ubonensis]